MSLNRVMLIGNLGQDPELRYTQSQLPVCNFSIATTDRRKDDTGNWNEHTEWHRVVVFGKTAENCSNYLKKGRQVFVEGRISTRKWQDKDGNDRYTTEVVGQTVQFLGNKGDNMDYSGSQGFTSPSAESKKPQASVMPGAPAAADMSVPFDDDDIPF